MKIELVGIEGEAQDLVEQSSVAVAAEQAWRIRHLERLLVLAYQAIDPEQIDSAILLEIEVQVGARVRRES